MRTLFGLIGRSSRWIRREGRWATSRRSSCLSPRSPSFPHPTFNSTSPRRHGFARVSSVSHFYQQSSVKSPCRSFFFFSPFPVSLW